MGITMIQPCQITIRYLRTDPLEFDDMEKFKKSCNNDKLDIVQIAIHYGRQTSLLSTSEKCLLTNI